MKQMENLSPATGNSPAAPSRKPARRVGTFTMGIVLVASGVVMLLALCFPELDASWAVKLSPLMLISLGLETLLAARGSERVRYDWAAMLLCCLIVCTALVLFCIAWCMLYRPEWLWNLL